MSNVNKTIGKNLKYLRRLKNIGLVDLSKLCNISKSAIGDIENLKHINRIDHHVPPLARALEVELDVLTESNPSINEAIISLLGAIASRNFSADTIALADRLIDETSSRGSATEQFEVIKARADISYRLGDYEAARDFYRRCVEISLLSGDLEDLQRSRKNVALTYLMQNRYEEMSTAIDEVLADTKTQVRIKADCYHLLSIACKRRMMYVQAEKYLFDAIKILGSPCDSDLGFVGQCYQVLGDLYRDLKEYSKSIEFSERATEICVRVSDNTTELYSRRTVALLYLDQGMHEDCLERMLYLKERSQSLKVHAKEIALNECIIRICSEDYDKLVLGLHELSGYEISPRLLAQLNECAASLAFKKGGQLLASGISSEHDANQLKRYFEEAHSFTQVAILQLKGVAQR